VVAVDEDADLEVTVERCAGLDVHKDVVVACVRVPAPGGGVVKQVAEFRTFTADLLALRDWLVSFRVTRVGMEATGVYWKPVFYALEDNVECWLLNARHMRNGPRRKTDMADADWICRLIHFGLVRPSFVPPKPIREQRALTRYRKTCIEERIREAQRLDKVLQDAGIKLSSVASDCWGAPVETCSTCWSPASGSGGPGRIGSRSAAGQAPPTASGADRTVQLPSRRPGRGDLGPSGLPR
jgi:transposase